jgi:conjugal transfer pilus assembly protein TrbC
MKYRFIAMMVTACVATLVYANDDSDKQAQIKQLLDNVEIESRSLVVNGPNDRMPIDKGQVMQNVNDAYTQHKNSGFDGKEYLDQAEAYMRENLNNSGRNKAVNVAADEATIKRKDGIDPAELAALYRKTEKDVASKDQGPVLMVFASTSIPAQTLQVIGQQAKLAGAPIFLRGVTGGFSAAGIRKTLEAMRPATEQGAEVQIHPEVFKRYGVTQVPAVVLAESLGGTCGGEITCGEHRIMVGDVTIEYALAQFVREGGVLGDVAREKLRLMEQAARVGF